ncbi:MAG: T9SS type A sorting domain-containing protein [Chitinophagales bacterium]
MMRQIFFISLVALICDQTFSQNSMDNWCFGRYCGLNFSIDTPVFFYTSLWSYEASASISDSSGNLLFYTDGTKIYDHNNLVMPNGNDINIGVITDYGSTITQGIIILPFPSSNQKYYVIYLADASDGILKLEYSVVDMTLNDEYGDVTEKNFTTSSSNYMWEKLSTVKHGNGKDWWLVGLKGTPNLGDSTFFEKFLVTDTGLNGPFYQFYGFYDPGEGSPGEEVGQMKFSPTGSKLANTRGNYLDIFDFDRCTGEFSNTINIDTVGEICYGLEFSPDETKLYVSTQRNNGKPPRLFQICLDCHSLEKTLIFRLPKMGYTMGQLQIAPNDKIYFSFQKDLEITEFNKNIYVINSPNSNAEYCDFDTILGLIGDTAYAFFGFPNMPNYNLAALTGADSCITVGVHNITNDEGLKIFPNPASSFVMMQYANGSPVANIQSIKVYNSFGVAIKEFSSITNAMDVSDIPIGIYFLKITTQLEQEFILKLEIIK